MAATTRRAATAVLAVLLAVVLSGCGLLDRGVYDMPLPGGADVGDDPITITADFDDVLDLVPQSSVKVENIAVGRVSAIRLTDHGRHARVELVVRRDVDLPAGTTARLQQTSLLGEKYVALIRPDEPQPGEPITDGAHIGLAKTSQAAEVEEVLGALSMVLNGGGIGQFREISRELRKVSSGRPGKIRAFLEELRGFVTAMDARKSSVTDAIDAVARLSGTLDGQKKRIIRALDGLSPGMKVISGQRKQLVKMLRALDRLSGVTMRTLDRAQDDIVADLKTMDPILRQLAKSGSDLPNSLQILLTYPFPDSVLDAIRGDYLNVFLTTNFRTVPADCAAIGCVWPQVQGRVAAGTGGGTGGFVPPKGAATATGSSSPSGAGSSPSSAPSDPSAPSDQSGSSEPSAAASSASDAGSPPPMLLPPTSSPLPGITEPTVTVPAGPSPSGGASASGSPSPGDAGSGDTKPGDPGPSRATSSGPGSKGSEPAEPDATGATAGAAGQGDADPRTTAPQTPGRRR